jgi:hypothetical protein
LDTRTRKRVSHGLELAKEDEAGRDGGHSAASDSDKAGLFEMSRREPKYDPFENTQERVIFRIGVALLIALLMPILVPTGWGESKLVFLNFLIFTEWGVPFELALFCLYPGIAGVVTIALAWLATGSARSCALIGIGVVGGILLLTMSPLAVYLIIIIFALALMGLFVGSRARFFRPGSQAAAIIGTVGGILVLAILGTVGGIVLLAGLVLPVLPGKAGPFPVPAPGSLLGALGLLAMVGCLIASSILCIMNAVHGPNSRRRAELAFLLLVAGCAALAISLLVALGEQPIGYFAAFLSLTKYGCWAAGLFLPVPVGVTHLICNLTPVAGAEDEVDETEVET